MVQNGVMTQERFQSSTRDAGCTSEAFKITLHGEGIVQGVECRIARCAGFPNSRLSCDLLEDFLCSGIAWRLSIRGIEQVFAPSLLPNALRL